jgi:hypothetical protein
MSLSKLHSTLEIKMNNHNVCEKEEITRFLLIKTHLMSFKRNNGYLESYIGDDYEITNSLQDLEQNNNTLDYLFIKKFVRDCIYEDIENVICHLKVIMNHEYYIHYFKNYIPYKLFEEYYTKFIENNEIFKELSPFNKYLHNNKYSQYKKYYTIREDNSSNKNIINFALQIIEKLNQYITIFSIIELKIHIDFPNTINKHYYDTLL